MDYNDFKNAVADYAKSENINDYELYYVKGQSISIQAYEKEINSFEHNTSVGVGFRCAINNKIGYSGTQDLSLSEAKRIVLDAKTYAHVLDENPYAKIYEGSDDFKAVTDLEAMDENITEYLKEKALYIEEKALELDEKIKSVPYAIAEYSYSERAIFNSHGIDMHDSTGFYVLMCDVLAEDENGRKYSGGNYVYFKNPDDVDVDDIIKKAVDEAILTMGAKKVKTNSYPIVLSQEVARTFLGVFNSVFSSDMVQKGLSLLKDKEGEIIASDKITLIEDPTSELAVVKYLFDDEGFKTYKKDIISNGKLQTLIYSLETAAKAKTSSTGNGMKGGYASPVGVGFTNLYLKPGDVSFDELLEKAENGIYITEMKGMHASADPVTGDFSLESKGFMIENGKLSYPVEQFTVAGNFYDVLKNVVSVADNLEFKGTIGSPSFLIKELSVSGEDD